MEEAAALPMDETFRIIGPHYPTVEIPESDIARFSKKWETSIVAQFSNVNQPALPFSELKARLLDGSWLGDGTDRRFTRPLWSFVRSKVEAFSLGGSLFVFRFSDESDLYNVMIGAPYDVDGRLLLLQRWKRGIDPVTHSVATAPLWLYMIRLPIEFWNEASMSQVAGPVGSVVKYPDLVFPEGGELGIAPRVLVEVDFDKELVMGTNVPLQDGGPHFVVFGYEHKARVCVRCGGAGARAGIRYPLCPPNGHPFVIVPPVPAAAGPIVHPLMAAQQQEEEEEGDEDGEEEDDHASNSSVHNA